ncbi:hypothetical protein J7E99_39385 [Streptomyces sp. ISL-44]|uniref:hypothetical protein n=1 Tax=Streptomyces sp. ISL-44 TaxID=2819184 RepID=UPI001BEA7693|nr:hypothetical protein [Streptomyces sp. ISL-44]MBT2546556.1 hypothetical protein [Streptomyces sp. ISL-44]
MSTSTAETFSLRVSRAFRFDVEMAFEDIQPLKLHYHLLRLTTAGLSGEEAEELLELGRSAFEGADVDAQCDRIRDRNQASALAVTIAGIVQQDSGPTSRGHVMLAALLGAYASMLDNLDQDRQTMAVLGAIGGAVAASSMPTALERIELVGLSEYLKKAE